MCIWKDFILPLAVSQLLFAHLALAVIADNLHTTKVIRHTRARHKTLPPLQIYMHPSQSQLCLWRVREARLQMCPGERERVEREKKEERESHSFFFWRSHPQTLAALHPSIFLDWDLPPFVISFHNITDTTRDLSFVQFQLFISILFLHMLDSFIR